MSERADFIQSGTGSVARSHKNGSHKFGAIRDSREKKLQTNCQGNFKNGTSTLLEHCLVKICQISILLRT